MKYPGGRVITYNYSDNKVTGILNNVATIASNISYKPFGGIISLTYGNNLQQTIGYDQRYRITSITTGTIQNLTYAYDFNGNIAGITNTLDNTKNKTYTYDSLDRLTGAVGPWGTVKYAYDGMGNRQTETNNAAESNYAYTANKLISTIGAKTFSFGYDYNGDTITENTRQYTYNQNQRVIRVTEGGVTKGEYVYNGNGQRVKKTTASGITIFHYDLKGQIMAESTTMGTLTAEYVFLNASPFAKTEGNNVYYYHNDHLGAPQKMTDSSGLTVWYGEFLPFGEPLSISGTITNHLRFPGQYYDEESGLHCNYFRDYEPMVGRYMESDPIGIKGGINHLYGYAENNPLTRIDSRGTSSSIGVVYGDFCGPGAKRNIYGPPSADCVDRACQKHDICYDKDKVKLYPPLPPSKKRRHCDAALCLDTSLCPDTQCNRRVKDLIWKVFNCSITTV